MEHLSKVIVRLERLEMPGRRRATLVKHRSQPEGASFDFEMVQDGIKTKE